jgi:hypothetical protein
MTASPGREVDANLLRGAALESAQAGPDPDDAGGQDLGDLVETLGGSHEIGMEGAGQGSEDPLNKSAPVSFLPTWRSKPLKVSKMRPAAHFEYRWEGRHEPRIRELTLDLDRGPDYDLFRLRTICG